MKLARAVLSLFPALASLVTSSPLAAPKALSPKICCTDIDHLISVLHLRRPTPFCSSYLHISPVTRTHTKTSTHTATATSTTVKTVTKTVVNTATATLTLSPTVVVTETDSTATTTIVTVSTSTTDAFQTSTESTVTATYTATTVTTTLQATTTVPANPATTTVYTVAPIKRAIEDVDDLEARGLFTGSFISEICSCLSLTTATIIKTAHATRSITTLTATTTVRTVLMKTTTNTLLSVTSPITSTTTTDVTSTETDSTTVITTVSSTIVTIQSTTVDVTSTTSVTTTVTLTSSQFTVTNPYPTQVVQNPSFETVTGGSSFFPGAALPWQGFGFHAIDSYLLRECDDQACAYDGVVFIEFDGDSPGGTASVTQTLQGIQPGHPYTLSLYVGFANQGLPGDPTSSYISATLDGVTILPEQQTCTSDSACPLKNDGTYGWRQIVAAAPVVPSSSSPVLSLNLRLVVSTTAHPQYPLLDLITLTRN